jgi:hypothetical protein
VRVRKRLRQLRQVRHCRRNIAHVVIDIIELITALRHIILLLSFSRSLPLLQLNLILALFAIILLHIALFNDLLTIGLMGMPFGDAGDGEFGFGVFSAEGALV